MRYCSQDNNGTIENEELRGFLKDLLELVKKVCIHKTVVKRLYFNILHNTSEFYAVATKRLYLVSSNYSNTLLVFLSLLLKYKSIKFRLSISFTSSAVEFTGSPSPNQTSSLKISSQNNLLQTHRKTIMVILGFFIVSTKFFHIYAYCKCLSPVVLH